MNREDFKFYASVIVCIIGVAFLSVVFVRYVLFAVLPFLLAWCVAFISRPLAKSLGKKIKLPTKLLRCLISLFFVLCFFVAVITLIWQAVGLIWDVLSDIGEGDRFLNVLEEIMDPRLAFFGVEGSIPEEMAIHLRDAIKSALTAILEGLGSIITAWISNVPGVFVFIVVTLISIIYFSWDLEEINHRLKAILPKKLYDHAVKIKDGFLHAGIKYVSSYLLLMSITFVILFVGLLILGVERPAIIALIVAALDVLPVLGVGTVLIPWSLVLFVLGNRTLAIGLVILFIINELVRQLSEPKILGKNLDTHPIVTIFLVYAGYSFFGVKGLLLVPFITVIINIFLGKKNSPKIE